jgi:phospholipid-binding lipoprotein MlaA
MGISALTTAMAVTAAAVPGGHAPASAAVIAAELAAADGAQWQVAAVGTETPAPLALAQASQGPPPPNQGNAGEVALAEQAQPSDPASGATTGSETPVPGEEKPDILVIGRKPNPADPLEELNSESFKVAQSVDKSVVAPIAFAYGDVMPRPVRKGLRNFLHNLGEPVVFLNYILQLKPGKAAETFARFAINTTLGWGGVIDVAKRQPFNLPHRDNGFANTLGYYGVGPGPYFYLPLVGPTTLRDFIGGRLDLLVMPTIFPKVFARKEIVVPVWVLSELGRRLEFDDQLSEFRATLDPYVAARTYYLQRRQAEIDALHGRKTAPPQPAPSSNPAPAPIPSAAAVELPPGQTPAEASAVAEAGSAAERQPIVTSAWAEGKPIFAAGDIVLAPGAAFSW